MWGKEKAAVDAGYGVSICPEEMTQDCVRYGTTTDLTQREISVSRFEDGGNADIVNNVIHYLYW